jgi:hypothetical protein
MFIKGYLHCSDPKTGACRGRGGYASMAIVNGILSPWDFTGAPYCGQLYGRLGGAFVLVATGPV